MYFKELYILWTHPKNRFNYMINAGNYEFDNFLAFYIDGRKGLAPLLILTILILLKVFYPVQFLIDYLFIAFKLIGIYLCLGHFYILKATFLFMRSFYLTCTLSEMEKDAIKAYK